MVAYCMEIYIPEYLCMLPLHPPPMFLYPFYSHWSEYWISGVATHFLATPPTQPTQQVLETHIFANQTSHQDGWKQLL